VIDYDKKKTEEGINKCHKDYKDLEFTEEIARTLLCMYWNFINKKPNMKEWFKKSKPVYSKACFVDENNQSLETLDPILRFVELVDNEMRGCFRMKNVIFLTIQTLSKNPNHELSVISKITMNYFMIAKMEEFAMIVDILSRESKLCSLKRIYKHFQNYNT